MAEPSEDEGKTWVWIAFAPEYRLFLALVVGPRTQEQADQLIQRTARVLAGPLPLFCSDGLDHYSVALLDCYCVRKEYPRTGRRGRPRKPTQVPLPDLRYAQVVKRREGRRLVEVIRKVVYGNPEEIPQQSISTSLLERQNLTIRLDNARLTRKTLAFSKDQGDLRAQLALYIAYANLVREHRALLLPVNELVQGKTYRKWAPRTPAMAAGRTDHPWSLRELLTYKHYITSSH
jgi:IS1 family transposase